MPLLTLPESNPDAVVGDDDSVAVDHVRALLDSNFTKSHASWIQLLLSLVTDARNGLLTSVRGSSLSRFSNLSPSETLQLTSLKRSLESLDTFFADTQDDPEDWITCMGYATSFQLPISKDDWDVYLSKCSGNITATCSLIVDKAVEAARLHMQAWADGERVSAQDAAIQHLASDHAPDISELISDPCLIEWSCCLLEAMKHHFTETLVTKASHTIPTHLSDCLDAKCQAKVDTARRDARAKVKRLYHAELTRLQSSALEEAARDFETWKSISLIPEWQAKEASAKAEKLLKFDAFKHGIAIELEEHKENAHITAAKSLVLLKTKSRSYRKSCCADPTRASCSASYMRTPSPSPSQKLDKMLTKADFLVSVQTTPAPLCTPVSDHARGQAGPSVAQEDSGPILPTHIVGLLSGPGIAKAPVGTLGDADSGLPLTLTSCLPEALPAAAPSVLSSNVIPDVVMASAAPSRDARPSLVRPVPGPDVTLAGSVHAPKAPLVERYQSVTPSPAPPMTAKTAEDRMMRLLGSTIIAALVPLKSSIEDISSRLCTVEDTQNWVPGDDGFPEDYDPATHGYDIPVHKAKAGGEERVDDYHTVSTPSLADAEDTEMEDAHRCFESHDSNEDPHFFFTEVVLHACNQTRDEIDPSQLATLADMAAINWDDFCLSMFLDRIVLPPNPTVGNAFITCMRMNLVKLQSEDDLQHALRAEDCGHSLSPETRPSYTGPFLAASRGDAGYTAAPVTRPLTQPHARLSEPISVSLDGSKILGFTESSPPLVRQGALDLDTPPPGDGTGWKVMGGKHGRTFASIAASCPTTVMAPPASVALPPSTAQATHGFLTKPQLDSLSREQVVHAYNARFTPKLRLHVSKDCAIAAFLDKALRPTPASPPAPQPITKTEFTLVYDTRASDLSTPSGRRGDTALYVRAIQKHMKDAGTKQAELISGCWTSQTSHNFVLTFNGDPSLDDILHLHSTFVRVLGPHYSIVLSRGYTRIVLNLVPTMREMLGALLPSAAALCTELTCNAGLKDLILLGKPYWLTARHPNARHGSISVAFLDPDGTRLKDIMRNPPFLFGNRTTRPQKYEARPLISQCDHCCYVPGHLAHIFLFFLARYVLIRSHDPDSHDRLPVQQNHLVGNFIVPSFRTFPIVLFLW